MHGITITEFTTTSVSIFQSQSKYILFCGWLCYFATDPPPPSVMPADSAFHYMLHLVYQFIMYAKISDAKTGWKNATLHPCLIDETFINDANVFAERSKNLNLPIQNVTRNYIQTRISYLLVSLVFPCTEKMKIVQYEAIVLSIRV